MLNLTHTLCLLSRVGTRDKNLSGDAIAFFAKRCPRASVFSCIYSQEHGFFCCEKERLNIWVIAIFLAKFLLPFAQSVEKTEGENCTPDMLFDKTEGADVS